MTILIFSQDGTYAKARLIQEFAKHNTDLLFSSTHKDFVLYASQNTYRKCFFKNELIDLPSAIIIRLPPNLTDYYFCSLIRQFESMGVPVINNIKSIELARDKFHTHQILSKHDISTPKTMIVKHGGHYNIVNNEIGFPCVLKTYPGSFGRGVKLCRTFNEFKDMCMFVDEVTTSHNLIAQQFISANPGKIIRSIVIGDIISFPMKRIGPRDGDIRTGIDAGNDGTTEKYPITEEIRKLSYDIVKIMNLDIAGIDFLFDNNKFTVSEVNVCPNFETYEKLYNTNLIQHIVNLVLSKI